jgi:outer membrane protein assembly factor BamB
MPAKPVTSPVAKDSSPAPADQVQQEAGDVGRHNVFPGPGPRTLKAGKALRLPHDADFMHPVGDRHLVAGSLGQVSLVDTVGRKVVWTKAFEWHQLDQAIAIGDLVCVSGPDALTALDLAGNTAWTAKVPANMGHGTSGPTPPMLHEGTILWNLRRAIFAVDPATGQQRYQRKLENVTEAETLEGSGLRAVVWKDRYVVVTRKGKKTFVELHPLSAEGKAEVLPLAPEPAWEQLVSEQTAVVGDLLLYMARNPKAPKDEEACMLAAFDLVKKKVAWTAPIFSKLVEQVEMVPSPVVLGDKVYVYAEHMGEANGLFELDAATGKVTRSLFQDVDSSLEEMLGTEDGVIYARNNSNGVYRIELGKGSWIKGETRAERFTVGYKRGLFVQAGQLWVSAAGEAPRQREPDDDDEDETMRVADLVAFS